MVMLCVFWIAPLKIKLCTIYISSYLHLDTDICWGLFVAMLWTTYYTGWLSQQLQFATMAKVEPLFDNFESTLVSYVLHNHEQDTLHNVPMMYKSMYVTHA